MGAGVTDAGDCTVEAVGTAAAVVAGDAEWKGADSRDVGDESPRQSLGLCVTEDRVLIRADREDHAPAQTAAGLYTASSLAAAVEGTDEAESWFVGTIVQVGPQVNRLDHRRLILRWLLELEDNGHDLALAEVRALRERVEDLPAEMPDPLAVGDRVAFSWVAGQQIAIDGERFLILRSGDVLAVLEDE